MIYSADGLQWTKDEPNLVVGLKGLVGVEISVCGPNGDQHSGLHGGAIANLSDVSTRWTDLRI